ncbi:hypothetical protein ACHAWO_011856 [Cyclotella atomus]|jgi:hypothetical protein|uniref:Uncharacterized protein n=1 Tax=Cyclotella atomus TaxID=382360 RepID=A0ABD3PR24_9STRA
MKFHLLLITVTVAALLAASANAFASHPDFNKKRLCSLLRSQPQPNFGDWTNDDFLNSLGGENNDPAENQQQQSPPQQQQQVPQNDLTDEEITMMAMRAAQFYNTETSIEEAYGIRREGPPRKQEE